MAILSAVLGKDAAYHLFPTGPIDFLGKDACYARSLTTCRIGSYGFPIDVCEERFYTPGLLAHLLADDTSTLDDPGTESAPLACPAPSPGGD